MILRKLRLHNFLVFFGEQEFSFPSDGDQNVTLILANNNTGKTTIIRALKFLFYGSHALNLQKLHGRPSSLISERAVYESAVADNIDAWVDLTFSLGDKDYRFRRKITATKTRDGLDKGTEKLCSVDLSETRVVEHEDDPGGTLHKQLATWMPRGLFDAFYFQGEPLDGKMLDGVSTISVSLTSFLHIDKWEEAADALAKVQQDYERQLHTVASAHREYQAKLSNLQTVEKSLSDRKSQLSKVILELQELESREALMREELRRLGDTAEYDRLLAQRDQLREKIRKLDSDYDRAHDRLHEIIEASQGAPFLLSAVAPARRVLAEMEKRNVLPADITEGFVERVLAQDACVCGRTHTKESREHWERYLETALSAKLSHRFMDILNRVSEGSRRGPVELAARTRRDLAEIQKHIERIKGDLKKLRDQLDVVDESIRQNPYADRREKIASTVDGLRDVSTRLRQLQGEHGTTQGIISNLELTVGRLRKEAKAAEPRGKAAAEIAQVQRAIEVARELREFIESYRVDLRRRLFEQLHTLVARHYDPHAVDRTKARVDPNSFLPYIVNQEGQQQSLVGGGQQTLLSLAYVAGLAQLRKGIHETMRALDLYLGKADDQSFVVDSPFAAVDPNYVRAIASFLTSGAKQVIILMARQQWDQAGPYLLPTAARIYALRLHTKLSELKDLHPEDFDFRVNGRVHRLISETSDTKLRFTERFEVT